MKLKELKSIIDQASEKAEGLDVDVELWWTDEEGREREFDIIQVGQFSVIPDVTLTITEV